MLPELFLSCDWGTTRFRLRLAEIETSRILLETTSDAGVAKIAAENAREARPEVYRRTLLAGINSLQPQSECNLASLPVMISGMASSSLGWCELPYAKLPFALPGVNAVWKELEPFDSAGEHGGVYLISGVCSEDDVIRGEETELLGAWQFAQSKSFHDHGLVILPGTHSKHLEIHKHRLVSIRTYMTGELFDVVGRHSVLRHSLPDSTETTAGLAETQESFVAGVLDGSQLPLSHALFHVRTKSLLSGMTPPECGAYLSGLLIGGELMALTSAPWNELPIVLCAGGDFSLRYELAIETLKLKQPVLIAPATEVSRLATLGQTLLLKAILPKRKKY
jgi:2-dehydro-3-deoxygalactonokinase